MYRGDGFRAYRVQEAFGVQWCRVPGSGVEGVGKGTCEHHRVALSASAVPWVLGISARRGVLEGLT